MFTKIKCAHIIVNVLSARRLIPFTSPTLAAMKCITSYQKRIPVADVISGIHQDLNFAMHNCKETNLTITLTAKHRHDITGFSSIRTLWRKIYIIATQKSIKPNHTAPMIDEAWPTFNRYCTVSDILEIGLYQYTIPALSKRNESSCPT